MDRLGLIEHDSGSLRGITPIPWPAGLAPRPRQTSPARLDGSLPPADVLVVTWTVDEGHALSGVLTPGFDSKADWVPYTKNFAAISAKMRKGCPALELGRLGTFWTGMIGTKNIVYFKSDSHMSQDGPELPNADVWAQIIADVNPSLVITTGTAGGIGSGSQVGDVLVSRYATFKCEREFKKLDGQSFQSAGPASLHPHIAKLLAANSARLPSTNTRAPQIVHAMAPARGVLTTDFFGFDDAENTYGLQGHGGVCEMGDAVLGMVAKSLRKQPFWMCVRNVSDPQMPNVGTLEQQTAAAGSIYTKYGIWSSVCSAITCWALIAA